jgi:uncharacterized protein HemY
MTRIEEFLLLVLLAFLALLALLWLVLLLCEKPKRRTRW